MLMISGPETQELSWTHIGKREWQLAHELKIPSDVGLGLFIVWTLHEEVSPPWYTCFDAGHGNIPAEIRDCL